MLERSLATKEAGE